MEIIFASNFLNHHQLPLCQAFKKLKDINFTFIATTPIPQHRVSLGYQNMNCLYDFVLRAYENESEYQKALDLCASADIVIIGSAPYGLIKKRLREHKLTFRYSERFYKTVIKPSNYLRRAITSWFYHGRFRKYPIYMLCASAYTAADCAKFGNYKNRCYKWGYFPETKKYESIDSLINSKKENSILWVGRFLDWKHPDATIRIAKKLKENGYAFELNIIGTGAMEQQLKKMISDYSLENEVHMLGSMKPEQVREYMEQSQIYLFTSDRNEGWGAVLNESMNSGCAVVASHAIGSVPFLIKNSENGIIYKDGDEEDLYFKVKLLLDNLDLCNQYGRQAYLTLTDKWSSTTAAKRFVDLSGALLNNEISSLFADGPCSKANILKDDWFK